MRFRVSDEQRFRENRGVGIGEEYVPWILTTDFSPTSTKFRIPGIKTNRLHHALSLLEARIFYCVELKPEVIEIREQFPLLPLSETVEIAEFLGIHHPKNNGNYSVRTVDLFVLRKDCPIAYSIKYKKDTEIKRNKEKFEIEKMFLARRGIELQFFTNEDLTRNAYKNADRIRCFSDRPKSKIPDDTLLHFFQQYKEYPDVNVKDLFQTLSNELNESYALLHHLFLHLVFKHRIRFDFNTALAFDLKMKDLSL
jgi:hypothetical protein